MTTQIKYAPKNINYFVWANEKLKRDVMRYVDGNNVRPLILSGPNGGGKSLLARLIPRAIEGDDVEVTRVDAEMLNSTDDVRKTFSRDQRFDRLFSHRGQTMTYTIVDEVNFNPRAKAAIRTCMDDMQGRDLTIMTTNEVEQIDRGIRSRAEIVTVPIVTPDVFVPYAQKILVAEGVVIDDALVEKVLENAHVRDKVGGNRAYYKALDDLIYEANQA